MVTEAILEEADHISRKQAGTSLAVRWLKLHALNAGGTGLIPGRETKILHTTQHGK